MVTEMTIYDLIHSIHKACDETYRSIKLSFDHITLIISAILMVSNISLAELNLIFNFLIFVASAVIITFLNF